MSRPPTVLSRRAALATLAAAAYASATAGSMVEGMAVENELGPVFSPTGPDAELYGAAEGFPIADRSLPIQPGNPYQPKYRVGAFSHFDEIYPTRRIKRAATPWTFKRSQAEFRLSAGEGVAADRRGSRRDMAFGCGRARTGALRIQCGAARLRLGRLLAHDGACQDKQICCGCFRARGASSRSSATWANAFASTRTQSLSWSRPRLRPGPRSGGCGRPWWNNSASDDAAPTIILTSAAIRRPPSAGCAIGPATPAAMPA